MAGVIYLLVVFGLLGTLVAFNRSRQRRTPPSKPAILPKPPPSEPRPDSPRINDEFLHKLYVLQARTMELPRPSTPDELLKITSFAELIEVLADPTVEVETLLRYFTGDDGLLAWAALNALARRPHDAAVEERLLVEPVIEVDIQPVQIGVGISQQTVQQDLGQVQAAVRKDDVGGLQDDRNVSG